MSLITSDVGQITDVRSACLSVDEMVLAGASIDS